MSATVLIADDDVYVRSGLRALFEAQSYVVLEAGSLSTATSLIEAHPLRGAIVDISIPADEGSHSWTITTEGLNLVRVLKHHDPRMGVVVLSAYAEHLDTVMDLLADGIRGIAYRLKGRRADDLFSLLQRVCDGKVEIDPEVHRLQPDLGFVLSERLTPDEKPWVERALQGLDQLTPQEAQVATLLAASYSPRGVAHRLRLRRADGVISRVYSKLGLNDLTTAAPDLRAIAILIKACQIRDLRGKSRL